MASNPEPLRPAYGIWGEDRGKVERAVKRLADRVADEGGMPADVFDASQALSAEVVAACETLSFGGMRLVIVRGVDAWRAEDVAPLVSYLSGPNSGTCLALVGDGPATPKLTAAVEAVGAVLAYGPDAKAKRGDRTKWFVNHFTSECQRHGARIPAAFARQVVARVGEDAMTLAHEAAKLAAAAGDGPIDRELVDALVVDNPEARAYELADAMVAGDRGRVYDLLDDLGSGHKPADPAVIHSTLSRHFRAVAVAQELGEDATSDAVGAVTGIKGYPAQKVAEHARSMGTGAAERCVARLATLELDLRLSAFGDLGRSADDGRRFVLELAARDLIGLVRA